MPQVTSSCVASIDYNEKTQQLTVYFVKGGEHTYSGVPKTVYDGFLVAPSKGKYFNAVVRPNYQ